MTAVIAWTCKPCGHHVEGLTVDEFMTLDDAHVCKVADVIRKGVRYYRDRSPHSGPIADWLESCARQADAMDHPANFSVCDEPSSVTHAYEVGLACPWEDLP